MTGTPWRPHATVQSIALPKGCGRNPAAIDAAIIGAGQKAEHYEISAYGTARTFAQTLGFNRVAELLQETLDEEKQADQRLTELAEEGVNEEATVGQAG